MKFWQSFRLFTLAALALVIFGMGASEQSFLADTRGIPFPSEEVNMSDIPGKTADGAEVVHSGKEKIADVLMAVFRLFEMLLGSVAIVVMVWSGLLLISNGGSEDKADEGKRGFTWALVGLVLLLMVEPVLRDVLYRDGNTLANAGELRKTVEAGSQLIIDAISWLEGLLIIAAVGYL